MELKEYKLGQLIEVTRGASLSGEYYAADGDHIRLTLGHFDYVNGGFKDNTSKDNLYFTGNVRDEFILNKGDIITPLTEQTFGLIGSTAIIPESGKYIQSQDIGLVKCNEDLLYPGFCYYLLPTQLVKNQLSAGAQQTSIRHTSPDKIKACKVFIPSLQEQKRIAHFLSSLDKKITINRAINQNLEALAKQLYDYWFVQFDFPNEEGKPYKSSGGAMVWNSSIKRDIPLGWEVLPLFEAISVQYGYPFATEHFTDEITNVPVVRIRDILDGTISAYSVEEADEKYRLKEGDVLVGMDGNFHINFWHNSEAYLNQRCVRLRPYNGSEISSIQILHSIMPYIKAKEQSAKGSTVGHLSDKDMKELFLIRPVNKPIFKPRKTFDDILSLVVKNRKEILTLSKQRDELLPLLMNGQVSLNSDLSSFLLYYRVPNKSENNERNHYSGDSCGNAA